MIKLNQTNLLTIVEITEYSVYAEGGEHDSIPLRDTPDGVSVGDDVWAYVYLDASDEVVATMATAYADIGECAYLEVISNGASGTFLNWGLPKDLILPFSEQRETVHTGNFCFVYIYLDEKDRPTASMKIHKFLDEDAGDLEINEAVDLMIARETDLGFIAVINNKQMGLVYRDEMSNSLSIGETAKGWVKHIRDDGKIDLNINKLDSETRDNLEETIVNQLKENNNRLNISDKSSPDLIYSQFGVSKNNFKRAIGGLYKKRIISVSPEFIELLSEDK